MDRARAVTSVLRSLLVLLPMLASHAGAQQGGPPDTTAALRNGPAATVCLSGVPTSLFAVGLPSEVLAQLTVHEAVHRRQLAGDCDANLAGILGDRARLADAETEAGCAQLEASVLPSVMARTAAVGTLSEWLRERFPDLTADTLNALIARRCGFWRRT